MKMLAFITWLVTSPQTGEVVAVTTGHPDECVEVGDRVATLLKENGAYEVDYFCQYTSAPATSMRPRARP